MLNLVLALCVGGPAAALPYQGWGIESIVLDDPVWWMIPGGFASSSDGALVMMAWIPDGSRTAIAVRHFSLDAGWGPLLPLDYADRGDSVSAAIDGPGNGTALLVWSQGANNTTGVYVRSFDPGMGWGQPVELQGNQSLYVNGIRLAVTENGNATVVWNQADLVSGGNFSVVGRDYSPTTGWSSPFVITTAPPTGQIDSVAIETSVSGVAITTWAENSGLDGKVMVATRAPGAAWTGPMRIDEQANVSSEYAHLSVDRAGNVMVVWPQEKANIIDLMSRRFTTVGGWENATAVEQDNTGDCYVPKIASDEHGNVAVVWQASNGVEVNIWFNRYLAGIGWGTPTIIEPWDSIEAQRPSVAVRANGDVVAAWGYAGPVAGVYVSTKRVGAPWESPVFVGGSDSTDHRTTWLFLGDRGDITVAWVQPGLDGQFETRANTFVALPDTTPPNVFITSPANRTTTNQSSVWVVGSTEPRSYLEVNGIAVAVAYNGSFSARVPLSTGKNRITATATDLAGNRGSYGIDITFADPSAALADSLEELRGLMNTTQAQLNLSRTELELARLQLNETAFSEASLEARLESLQANLSGLEATIENLSAQLSDAVDNESLQERTILDLRARLDGVKVALEGSLNAEVQLREDIEKIRTNVTLTNAKVSDLDRDNDALRAENNQLRADIGALTAGALLGIVLSSAMSIFLNLRSRRSMVLRIEQLEARIDAAAEARPAGGPVPAPDLEVEAFAPKPSAEPQTLPCPQCGVPVAQGAPWCVACGLDLTWN